MGVVERGVTYVLAKRHTDVPLRERLLTLDAGLRNAPVTQNIRAQDGDYRGLVTGNQAAVQAVLDDRIAEAVVFP
jgi:hypothetical protein